MQRFLLFLLLGFSFQLTAQDPGQYAQDRVVLRFTEDAIPPDNGTWDRARWDIASLDALSEMYGVKQVHDLGGKGIAGDLVLHFESPQDIDQAITDFRATGLFRYVEPDYVGGGSGQAMPMDVMPNDTFFWRQYGLHNDGSFTNSPAVADADIDMPEAWEIEQGSSDIIVAVLDSGMKLDHPEISGRLWVNSDESNSGTDSDSNGYADDINGWDFANVDADPTDDHGHGTNVAGIAVANGNNGTGYAGVDWNCQLMTLKILNNENWGYYSWWTDAIYYATDNGARVLNMSVGGSGFSSSMQTAVDYAYANGVTIVVSMMNFNNAVNYYPAAYTNTIAVGSTDANDQRTEPFFWSSTSGSNYGAHIDVCAPGNYIYGLRHNSNTNYSSYWGGTSQAAPLVTGLASLLLAQDPGRTPDDLRAIIRETAEDEVGDAAEDTPGFDQYHGYGRINAHLALSCFPYCHSSVELGCTDDAACNYQPTATFDDGSCEYASCDLSCLADFNENGFIDTGDLLAILGEYGCSVDCTKDINGDGLVGTNDLLDVIGVFGTTCDD